MGTILVDGIQIDLQKKRIKNLHLHVKPDGRVYVTIPRYATRKEAEAFVRENIRWIEKQKQQNAQRPTKEDFKECLPELTERIKTFLPKWEMLTGLSCSSWHIRYMTSRWGSCIPSKGRICFNLQLADKSDPCLEYVILHELLHLRHKGHGEDFKKDLTRFMPQWKQYSKMLRQ